MGEADAMLRHWTVGCARHAAIGGALEGLVEHAGTSGHEADAKEGLEQPEMEG